MPLRSTFFGFRIWINGLWALVTGFVFHKIQIYWPLIINNKKKVWLNCMKSEKFIKCKKIAKDTLHHFTQVTLISINPFQPSVVFHIGSQSFVLLNKQMTGLYMKRIKIWKCHNTYRFFDTEKRKAKKFFI